MITTDDAAEAAGVSPVVLQKLLRRIRGLGLVRGKRGRSGGLVCTERARRSTLLEIVEGVSGPLPHRTCMLGEDDCNRCPLPAWHELCLEARRMLAQTTLAALARQLSAAQGDEGLRLDLHAHERPTLRWLGTVGEVLQPPVLPPPPMFFRPIELWADNIAPSADEVVAAIEAHLRPAAA